MPRGNQPRLPAEHGLARGRCPRHCIRVASDAAARPFDASCRHGALSLPFRGAWSGFGKERANNQRIVAGTCSRKMAALGGCHLSYSTDWRSIAYVPGQIGQIPTIDSQQTRWSILVEQVPCYSPTKEPISGG